MKSETQFLLERAEQEAVRALQADGPEPEAIHREMSARYSAKAVRGLARKRPGRTR